MDRGVTPFPIASDITDLALRYHPGSDISFLEPCVGTGIFFSAFLHDAADHAGQLRIQSAHGVEYDEQFAALAHDLWAPAGLDRKSTRLNSSHVSISYAVFCLKRKSRKR